MGTETIFPSPPGLPVFGHLLYLRPRSSHLVLERWAQQLGTPYWLRMMARRMLVIADPVLIGDVLRARPNTFRRTRPVESVFRELGIAGVFSSEGEDWARQRRLVMRAFDPTHMRRYFPALVQVTERLRKRWLRLAAQAGAIDIQAEFMRYTVDVTAGLAFGVDINTIEHEGDVIQQHLDKVFPGIARRMVTPYPYWRRFKLPHDRALDRHLQVIRTAIDGFVAQARQRIADDPRLAEQPSNLIEALLVARDAPGSEFSEQDVTGNVFTALLAGEDTTANSLAWMIDYLCDRPQLQQQLADEARAAAGAATVIDQFERADQLPMAQACATEAMRLKPVAPVLSFETIVDTRLGDIELPRNSLVTTLMRLPGLDPRRFTDPTEFQPQRWLAATDAPSADVAEQQRQAKRALMPFGGGPRFCPGRYLAMIEIKMVSAMLAANFIVERVAGTTVRERSNLSMMPVGLRVHLRPRL